MRRLFDSLSRGSAVKSRSNKGAWTFLVLLVVCGVGGALALLNYFDRDVFGDKPVIELYFSDTLEKTSLAEVAIGRKLFLNLHNVNQQAICSVEAVLHQQNQSHIITSRKEKKNFVDKNYTISFDDLSGIGLKEGAASFTVKAKNCSLISRFYEKSVPVTLDFTPPSVELTSAQYHISKGGAAVVTYLTSVDAVASAVRVGANEFRGYPVQKNGDKNENLAFFVFSYDTPADAAIHVVAMDSAGNESQVRLDMAAIKNTSFRHRNIEISPEFIQSKIYDIINNTPTLSKSGDLVSDFVVVNSDLRRENTETITKISRESAPLFYWKDSFVPMKNASMEATFADYRSYIYKGEKVDEQVHLGFDLASIKQDNIPAAGRGKVLFTGYLGIYGNTVILDHGFGLVSLYGHLSQISVSKGQLVEKGALIGKSGATGLAGGDHLHFSMLIQGVQTNPIEFLDQHWIEDNIYLRLHDLFEKYR